MTTYVQPGVLVSESSRQVASGTFSGNRRIGIIATGNPTRSLYDMQVVRIEEEAPAGQIYLKNVTPVLNSFSVTATNKVRYISATVGVKIVFNSAYDTAVGNIINLGTTYYATLDTETNIYSVSTTPEDGLEVVAVLGSGGTVGEGEIDIKTILNATYDSTVNDYINSICQTNKYLTKEGGIYKGGATWNQTGVFYLINDTFMEYNTEGYAIVSDTETVLTVIANPASDFDEIPDVTAEELKEVIRVGTLPGMSDYAQYHEGDTTYDYKVIGNTIDWAGGARRPSNGATYYVSYALTKGDDYYKPLTYYSFSEMEDVEGEICENGIINNMLLAAKIAFANGAPEIVVRQLYVPHDGSPNNSEIDSALDDMGAVDIEILLTPYIYNKDADIMSRLQQWNTSQIKKERLWFTSTDIDSTPATIKNKAISMASSLYATVIAPKGNVTVTDGITGEDVVLDVPGDFFGAAVAGLMCNPNYDKANPITNQAIAGISYPTNMPATPVWTDNVMNDMAANGVLLMYNDNGITRVRHALTTNTRNQMTQELQVRWISLLTKKEIRLALKPYIGTKAVQRVVGFVNGTIRSYLEQGITDEIYTDYANLVTAIDTTDIRRIKSSVDIQPVGTTTWITLDFGFVNTL